MLPEESLRFADRSAAGRALATEVQTYLADHHLTDRPLVLGMTRGGVPVAVEVARELGADLDVIVVVPIGLPWRPEFSVGAVAENGHPVIDHDALARANVSAHDLGPVLEHQRTEITRQLDHYRGGHTVMAVTGRTVIVIDDGLQSGVRATAALRALHAELPAHLVFAAPVSAAESTDRLAAEADGLIHLRCPCCYNATNLWYRDATDVTDEDVLRLLHDAWTPAHA